MFDVAEKLLLFRVKSYFSDVNNWALISICFIYKRDSKHLIYNKCLDTLPQKSLLIYILIDFGTNLFTTSNHQ